MTVMDSRPGQQLGISPEFQNLCAVEGSQIPNVSQGNIGRDGPDAFTISLKLDGSVRLLRASNLSTQNDQQDLAHQASESPIIRSNEPVSLNFL